MSRKLQFKRGTKAQLPILTAGEPGWVTDEKKLYVGTGSGNVSLARGEDLDGHASDAKAHKTLFEGKADLVGGKVKADQLPAIKTDQVVEQPNEPTSPDTILWVDTDAETPGVDIETVREEAEAAHTTADSAITRLNGVDEKITAIQNTLIGISDKVSTLVSELNSRQTFAPLTLVPYNSDTHIENGYGYRANNMLFVSAGISYESGWSGELTELFSITIPKSGYGTDLINQQFVAFIADAVGANDTVHVDIAVITVTSTIEGSNIVYKFYYNDPYGEGASSSSTIYICGIAVLAPSAFII